MGQVGQSWAKKLSTPLQFTWVRVYSIIESMIKNFEQWVLWKRELRDGKITKVPYQMSGSKADSTQSSTWSTFEIVSEFYKKHTDEYDGIGYVFTKETGVIGLDFDHCLNEKGEIEWKEAKEIFEKIGSYTEISPSGDGLHIFVYCKGELDCKKFGNKKPFGKYKFEIYNEDRFFTYTENRFNDKEITSIGVFDLLKALNVVGYPFKKEKEQQGDVSTGALIPTDVLLKRILKGKQKEEFNSLFKDGKTDKYDNDVSAAEFRLCCMLAFWTQKNKEQMREIWLQSKLAKREKTLKRIDYQDRTLDRAIQETETVYNPPENKHVDIALSRNENGVPFLNAYNVSLLIEDDEDLRNRFRYNDFLKEEQSNMSDDDVWSSLQKADIVRVMLSLQKEKAYFERVTENCVEHAIVSHCRKNRVNPPQDYIRSLSWDGQNRLDIWLHKTYGTPDDTYHKSVGANWMKGLVKRIMHPGSKFDFVFVLESPQGWKKSTSLNILGRGWHVETTLSPDNKDFFMILTRNAIIEFSEGETLSRAEIKQLKSVITMTEDQYRAPYGRSIERYPRHCVFAMTTNQSEYLRDETGNRRWLPVECGKEADLEWLERNVDQLYAEAYVRAITKNETTWEFPFEELIEKQRSRTMNNPYEGELLRWYFTDLDEQQRNNGVTVIEAYQQVFQAKVPMGREVPRGEAMVVASLFRNILFLEKVRHMMNGFREWKWFPTQKTFTLYDTKKVENVMEKVF